MGKKEKVSGNDNQGSKEPQKEKVMFDLNSVLPKMPYGVSNGLYKAYHYGNCSTLRSTAKDVERFMVAILAGPTIDLMVRTSWKGIKDQQEAMDWITLYFGKPTLTTWKNFFQWANFIGDLNKRTPSFNEMTKYNMKKWEYMAERKRLKAIADHMEDGKEKEEVLADMNKIPSGPLKRPFDVFHWCELMVAGPDGSRTPWSKEKCIKYVKDNSEPLIPVDDEFIHTVIEAIRSAYPKKKGSEAQGTIQDDENL